MIATHSELAPHNVGLKESRGRYLQDADAAPRAAGVGGISGEKNLIPLSQLYSIIPRLPPCPPPCTPRLERRVRD